MNGKSEPEESPTHYSQQIVSDDDEIDYSSKPEFYDPKLDDNDEIWAQKQRGGRISDAVLSCPACFTTLCLDCQRHEKYLTQYRAMFVKNCNITDKVKNCNVTVKVPQPGYKRKREKGGSQTDADSIAAETYKHVCCSVCSTQVGVVDEDEVYHFFNVIASES